MIKSEMPASEDAAKSVADVAEAFTPGGADDAPHLQTGSALRSIASTAVDRFVQPEQAPRRLFHYTSSAGLLGILDSNELRFSDPFFLNDGSEVFYGADMFRTHLEERLKGFGSSTIDFANRLVERLYHDRSSGRGLIFCLSEEGNLLNQWRDYGKDIVPYSIEFEMQELVFEGEFPALIFKMVYDHEAQTSVIAEMVDKYIIEIQRLWSLIENDADLQNRTIMAMSADISHVLTQFKNSAFAPEREWRLVTYPYWFNDKAPDFRTSSLGVVPYVSRGPKGGAKGGGLLPIVAVGVGPSPHGKTSQLGLSLLLHRYGYGQVPTWYSTIPAR
ncbi:DUF2971 domain-containing protein [Devosia sp. RR2S18]|uniref:DUF2971 domain-containing protein n=1 Tax=Devosia rhizosphaerae TaxID=3049774 RepID=UPI0025415EC8|nr:DUF2971 domain-containing protein [Devosia sp. RR2S18]WIJ24998.1 DUF2971 domain-containing protein [Devosia sp. RR2S18]